jgi:hypothetical protein
MTTKLILALIALGVGLAATGELSSATHAVARLAAESQKNDMIGLGQWNRTLVKSSDRISRSQILPRRLNSDSDRTSGHNKK